MNPRNSTPARAPERASQAPACAGCNLLRAELEAVKRMALAGLQMHLMQHHPACRCGALVTRSTATRHAQGDMSHSVCDRCGPINAGEGATVVGSIDVRHADAARLINSEVEKSRLA